MNEFQLSKIVCKLLSLVSGVADQEFQNMLLDETLWPELFRVAGSGFITPALAGKLREHDLLCSLPEDAATYLENIWQLNTERNETLKTELFNTIAKLNKIDVRPLLLKGAINLVEEQYPGCKDRVIGDLDIAVPEERIEECFRLLARNPYRAELEFGQKYQRDCHRKHPHQLPTRASPSQPR